MSTGQGILGNNMFAYCLNNPVMYSDNHGKLPILFGEDYSGYIGRKAGDWLREVYLTDENETNASGSLTINAGAKRIGKMLWNNLDCSAGVGMGYEYENTILEAIGFGIGMHGDMFSVHLQEGEISFGQEYSSGVATSFLFHNVGYVESMYNKNFKKGVMETSKGFYGDDTWTLYSISFYAGIGGNFRIGFDLADFIRDFEDKF